MPLRWETLAIPAAASATTSSEKGTTSCFSPSSPASEMSRFQCRRRFAGRLWRKSSMPATSPISNVHQTPCSRTLADGAASR